MNLLPLYPLFKKISRGHNLKLLLSAAFQNISLTKASQVYDSILFPFVSNFLSSSISSQYFIYEKKQKWLQKRAILRSISSISREDWISEKVLNGYWWHLDSFIDHEQIHLQIQFTKIWIWIWKALSVIFITAYSNTNINKVQSFRRLNL